MKNRAKLFAVTSALAMTAMASGADAAVPISGSGIWDATVITTPLSAPGSAFSFSFSLPDSFFSDGSTAFTSDITGFSFTLDGTAVSATPDLATFYSDADGGGFDLSFGGTILSILTPDIGSTGTLGPIGSYGFTAQVDFTGAGVGTLAVGVPEPATWGLMILGFGAVGGAMRSRREKTSVRYATAA